MYWGVIIHMLNVGEPNITNLQTMIIVNHQLISIRLEFVRSPYYTLFFVAMHLLPNDLILLCAIYFPPNGLLFFGVIYFPPNDLILLCAIYFPPNGLLFVGVIYSLPNDRLLLGAIYSFSKGILFFATIYCYGCFFRVRLCLFCVVIRFSSPSRRPMSSVFEGFSSQILPITFFYPILILEKAPVFPF